MPDTNGKQTGVDIVHRLGIWLVVFGLGAYMMDIGAWVGAADEKFKDAQTVEEKQDALILDVNTIKLTQVTQTKAIEANATAIEESKDEILDAIKEANKE